MKYCKYAYQQEAAHTGASSDLIFWGNILMGMIYLDNGATSFPKPPGMAETMAYCMKTYCGNPGRSGHRMSIKTG